MIVAMVDIGAVTAKTVISGDNQVLRYSIISYGHNVEFAE